jgi:monoterpene epsilon-lactone hydrolase
MMASKQSEELKRLYQGWAATIAANPNMSLDEWRDLIEHWAEVTAEPRGVDYLETMADGVPAMWAMPKRCIEDRVLLSLHGGGYVTGSIYTHRKLFAHIAKSIGCRALLVEYRRAPEHVHPAQLDSDDGVLVVAEARNRPTSYRCLGGFRRRRTGSFNDATGA